VRAERVSNAVDKAEQMFENGAILTDLCHILWINPVDIPTSCARPLARIGLR
jgi:hypothetical protein